jgi:predicted dehydrogenase
VPDFVLPFRGDELHFSVTNSAFETRGCDFEMERRTREVAVAEHANSHPTAQEANLFRTFSDLVVSGRRNPHWGEIALQTQLVLDACWRSAREGRAVGLSQSP